MPAVARPDFDPPFAGVLQGVLAAVADLGV
jgi:hypothetical protein